MESYNSRYEHPEERDDRDRNREKDEAGGWTREDAVGKGLSGALKWSKFVGILDDDESKSKSKSKDQNRASSLVDYEKKEIRIERRDEFGRIMTPKEAFRVFSHKFHGKGPGKKKQEKRMKQYHEELKFQQELTYHSDTPSLSVERMREAQRQLKIPYLALSGYDVKPSQLATDPDPNVEKDLCGRLTSTSMVGDGDRKVVRFVVKKRKAEPANSGTHKK